MPKDVTTLWWATMWSTNHYSDNYLFILAKIDFLTKNTQLLDNNGCCSNSLLSRSGWLQRILGVS